MTKYLEDNQQKVKEQILVHHLQQIQQKIQQTHYIKHKKKIQMYTILLDKIQKVRQ